MGVQHLRDRPLQPGHVDALIQLEGKGQIPCGIAPDHIAEVLHHIGKRILLARAVIDLLRLFLLQKDGLDLLHRRRGHELVVGNITPQLRFEILDQHKAAERIQPLLEQILVHTEIFPAEHRLHQFVDLLLQLGLGTLHGLLPLLGLLLRAKELGSNDLLRGGLLERIAPHRHGRDAGIGGQLLILPIHDLLHRSFYIRNPLHLGVLVIRIHLRHDLLSLPVHQNVRHKKLFVKLILNALRGNILAVGEDDQVLLPACQIKETVLIQMAQVAGLQPSVPGNGLPCLLLILVVAHHHRRALDLDLAVFNANLTAPHHESDRPHLVETIVIRHGDLRRALAHPIALSDTDADVPEPSGQLR